MFSRCYSNTFLGFVLFLEPKYGKNVSKQTTISCAIGFFISLLCSYRFIAIDRLEHSELMEKINFRKWSALMRIKFDSLMITNKQTLLS
jgi:hypothetical protein